VSTRWLRLYDELVDDPKILLLPLDLRWSLIALWCVASQNDGRLPSLDAVAIKLREKPARTRKILTDLMSAGFIDEDEKGLLPHNWNGRQFKSDGASTDRVKRFRRRQTGGSGNDDETFHETPNETLTETRKKRPQSQKQNQSQKGESDQHPPETVAAPARGQSLVSLEAIRIADEIGEAVGFSKETWPPGWCGAAYVVQRFLNEGCPGEVISLAVTATLKRKRDGPPENFSYFEKPIAAAFAAHKRPLPTASPQAFDGKSNGHSSAKRTVVDAGKDLIAECDARLAAAEAREAREREGDAFARLLPPERRN
jgi:hypothetical protein